MTERVERPADVLLSPRSVVVVGASARPGALSERVVGNLVNNGYSGQIHLVGRRPGMAGTREILPSIDDLPEGIDLAVLTLPADAVRDTIYQLGERSVRTAVCFASGFAEMGESGRSYQDNVTAVARDTGVRLLGPNTVGYYNYVEGIYVSLTSLRRPQLMTAERGPGVGIIAQSGAAGKYVEASLAGRGIDASYLVATGNEADLTLADFVEFFVDEPATACLFIYAEQIREPERFLAAVRRIRHVDKHVVLLHPGRSAGARAAALSHTGALTGDHDVAQAVLRYEGLAVVRTLEDAVDVTQLLLRFPHPSSGGIGLITGSGATCTLLPDYCEELDVPVPALSEGARERIEAMLPAYLSAQNPLDVGTGVISEPQILAKAVEVFVEEPAVGGIVVAFPIVDQSQSVNYLDAVIAGTRGSSTPTIYVAQGEDQPFWDAFQTRVDASGAVVMRSPDRAVRALTALRDAHSAWGAGRISVPDLPAAAASRLRGVVTEWRAKALLAQFGVRTPAGALARTSDEAADIAGRIGYPVAVKVQSSGLSHKTDAGAVALGLSNEAELRATVHDLLDKVAAAEPKLTIDGVLVEEMCPTAVELVIGAKRDPQWGALIVVGLGGIWIETLHDVRLMPADVEVDGIVAELGRLKGFALLQGARGAPPVDLHTVAATASAVGTFALAHEEVVEIDLNPVVATPSGVVALDALIVARGTSDSTPAAAG